MNIDEFEKQWVMSSRIRMLAGHRLLESAEDNFVVKEKTSGEMQTEEVSESFSDMDISLDFEIRQDTERKEVAMTMEKISLKIRAKVCEKCAIVNETKQIIGVDGSKMN
jgi:hypothetical protein